MDNQVTMQWILQGIFLPFVLAFIVLMKNQTVVFLFAGLLGGIYLLLSKVLKLKRKVLIISLFIIALLLLYAIGWFIGIKMNSCSW
jgi:hypothetical protein